MKRKISRKMLVGVFAVLIVSSVASAALLSHFGQVQSDIGAKQLFILDDIPGAHTVTHTFDLAGGYCNSVEHTITNQGSDAEEIILETHINGYGKGAEGVDVTYYKYVGYHLDETVTMHTPGPASINVDVVVEEVGNWLQWTLTYSDVIQAASVNIDYPLAETGTEICIHNNDGQDPVEDPGTWLYTDDGETTHEGGTLVTDLWWVTAEGERNVDSTYVIKIHKSQIDDCFHWHVKVTPTGGPMYGTDYDGSSWGHMIDVCLWEELTTPFTLQPGETMPFMIKYCLDRLIQQGPYTVTTRLV